MQKRGLLLTLIIGIFLISFVSAQFLGMFYGSYFDESVMIYGGLFVLFFALINFLLGRTLFRENQATRVIIGLVISLFAVYGISTRNWGISTGNFYVGGFYFGEFWPSILTVLLLVGVIYSIYKWHLKNVLSVIGLLLILTSLTNLVYEKNALLFTGIILLVIGLLLQFRRPRIRGIPLPRMPKVGKPGFMRSPQERLERYQSKQDLRNLKRQEKRGQRQAEIRLRKEQERQAEIRRRTGPRWFSNRSSNKPTREQEAMARRDLGMKRAREERLRRGQETMSIREQEKREREKREEAARLEEKGRKMGLKLAEKTALAARKAEELRQKAQRTLAKGKRKLERKLERTRWGLQRKYDSYSKEIKKIWHRHGQIPSIKTSDGHKYHRYIQAMRAIENLAAKKGVTLKQT